MNDATRKFLGDPKRVSERFMGGGWRLYVFTKHAALFDAIAQLDASEIPSAIATAKEPEGWITRLIAWCATQEACSLRNKSGICSRSSYISLTAAATRYMIIDLETLGYRAQIAARDAKPDTQTKGRRRNER